MGGDSSLTTITHIIIDEIHERDRFSDMLLTVLRDALRKHSHLKLVMMSATFDSAQLRSFFGTCPLIHVPGVTFDVSEMFLVCQPLFGREH